jgi:hypothetical protein
LFKSTSTLLFTGSTFDYYLKYLNECLIQHSLKSGDIKDHFRQVKVPGTTPYSKTRDPQYVYCQNCHIYNLPVFGDQIKSVANNKLYWYGQM